jgi:hypothetical protein
VAYYDYDYAPVMRPEEDEEEAGRSLYPYLYPAVGAPDAGAPDSAPAPEPKTAKPARPDSAEAGPPPASPQAPTLRPAQARLSALAEQGAPAVQPLHGFKKGLDIVGQILAPGIEERFRYAPQREYARQLQEAESEVAADEKANPQPKPKEEKWAVMQGWQGPNGEPLEHEENSGEFRIGKAVAGAKPTPKEGLTPEETTIHDLMTGNNGAPRINPKTGQPFTYLDAYTAVNQAKQDVKPPAKPDTPEQQFIDEYQTKHKGATVAQAVQAYAAATQKPEKPGAGNARSDKSYTYNNDKLDKLAKPIEDAVGRMGRLRETLAQGTPQADALVAPELLTIMAGGAGSGLRMNEAEIARIVGGRSAWENLRAKIQHWSTNPEDARSITPDQDKQIRALVEAVNQKLVRKQKALDDAREKLLDSDDPKEHRRIVTDAHHALTQVDEEAGGELQPPKVADPGMKWQHRTTNGKTEWRQVPK